MNPARPGREQPKLGRAALEGVRVRVKGLEGLVKPWASSLGDPPPLSSFGSEGYLIKF